jgi:N-acetyl-gamma-glutamyl-phosphate reductase
MTTLAVIGASGFSGMELCRLACETAGVELVAAITDRWQGERLGDRVEVALASRELIFTPQADAMRAVRGASIVALATPAEVSLELAPALLDAGHRVIDLSGAFRLEDPVLYPRWYAFSHPSPALLREARYALPQLEAAAGDAPPIAKARLVANPGCYATAAILALAPLLRTGLVDASVFVDGKSGVTGAGRKVAERYLFTEVSETVAPYRVIDHQHVPEIEQALARASKRDVRVTFAPHLLPIHRGLITTAFGRLTSGADDAAVTRAIADAYAGSDVVRVAKPDAVTIAAIARTPRAIVGAKADPERGTFVSICAIDNLLKGAASQAMENILAMAAS